MRLGALIEAVVRASGDGGPGALRVVRGGDLRVCDVTEDSRTAMPGSLFVARRGASVDGRGFVGAAVSSGAECVLTDEDGAARVPAGVGLVVAEDVALAAAWVAEAFYGFPSRSLKLLGVTGTNGKTTVAHLVHGLLNRCGVRCGVIGSVVVDNGRGVTDADLTTPGAVELSQTLASMVEAGVTHAAMEVSSHALDQGRAAALTFDVGVFTNLSGDHLDYHGTMEAYAAAKARLFEGLGGEAVAVMNAGSAWSARMLEGCGARVVRTAGERKEGVDVWCDERGDAGGGGLDGASLAFGGFAGWVDGGAVSRTRLIGSHNRSNIAQAVAGAVELGVDVGAVLGALPGVGAPPGRLERVEVAGGAEDVAVFVDFAHTDDALRRCLLAVREAMGGDGGRLCVVFGCGGDRDRTKRPRMGRVAGELADRVIVTSDNPRTERPSDIVSEVISGMEVSSRSGVEVHVDRRAAIGAAVVDGEAGDVVVIAGKGHEREQIVPDGAGGVVRLAFDDREEAAGALVRRAGRLREVSEAAAEADGAEASA